MGRIVYLLAAAILAAVALAGGYFGYQAWSGHSDTPLPEPVRNVLENGSAKVNETVQELTAPPASSAPILKCTINGKLVYSNEQCNPAHSHLVALPHQPRTGMHFATPEQIEDLQQSRKPKPAPQNNQPQGQQTLKDWGLSR